MGLYHTLLRFISMHGFMIIALGASIGGGAIAIFDLFSRHYLFHVRSQLFFHYYFL